MATHEEAFDPSVSRRHIEALRKVVPRIHSQVTGKWGGDGGALQQGKGGGGRQDFTNISKNRIFASNAV